MSRAEEFKMCILGDDDGENDLTEIFFICVSISIILLIVGWPVRECCEDGLFVCRLAEKEKLIKKK